VSPAGRDLDHYTADRPLDFLHMRLDLTFTAKGLRSRTCDGRVEYTLRPTAGPVRRVRLDAVAMRVLGVELPGETKPPAFSYDDKTLTVRLPRPAERTFRLAVTYRLADPPKGMHFILPSASDPKKPLMVYTMSEPLEARYWVPTHDWPNQRWTSDVRVTVPAPYTVVANGVLRTRRPTADCEAVTFHWRNDVPTDPHLMGLALGELVELRDRWRGKPVVVYTQRGAEAAARYTFRRVPEMLELFTRLTGVDFPYPGYTHVTVVEHHHGGMEHAGFSFVNPNFLAASDDGEHPLEMTEAVYLSHMLAHQWFGGIVNYRSVSQAWLNEGFARVLDLTWTAHTDSPDRFPCELHDWGRRVAASDSSTTGKPMVNRDLGDVEEIYTFDGGKIYYKGAWVLHMLRHQLGEACFWRGVRRYLRRHRGQGVETADLRRALEDVSGRDLEQFFRQWVYGHGVPRLDVAYSWDGARRRAKVVVRQTQKIDAATPAFAVPLDLYFRVGGEDHYVTEPLTDARHEFTYDFASEPAVFCVDPRGGLLKTLTVHLPRAMLCEQARTGPTALTRLLAAEELGRQPGPDTVRVLEEVVRKKSEYWMVRQRAARALGRVQTGLALRALLRAERDDLGAPRVLAGVVEALGRYPASREAHEAVLRHAKPAARLYVEMAAVSALGGLRSDPGLVGKSLRVLERAARKPTRRAVRGAALQALAALDDPRSYEAVLRLAQPGRGDELRGQAVTVLGRLGRHDGLRDQTRAALTAWLDDPDRSIQAAAAAGLGALGDPRALADLERLRGSARAESLRRAAEQAIAAISRPQDPKGATAGLSKRLAAIEKKNQELEKRLKDLADKLDALRKSPPKQTGRGGGKD
jgi:aminopeptidase N